MRSAMMTGSRWRKNKGPVRTESGNISYASWILVFPPKQRFINSKRTLIQYVNQGGAKHRIILLNTNLNVTRPFFALPITEDASFSPFAFVVSFGGTVGEAMENRGADHPPILVGIGRGICVKKTAENFSGEAGSVVEESTANIERTPLRSCLFYSLR